MLPYADRINSHIQRPGDFGSGLWTQLTAIILPVGKQDDNLAFGLCVFQSVDGHSKRRTNGRTVFDHPDFDLCQHGPKECVIEREGRLRVGIGREHDQTNPVRGASGNELSANILGCLESVRCEIFCPHGRAGIQHHHDVHAFCELLPDHIPVLRTHHGHDGQ